MLSVIVATHHIGQSYRAEGSGIAEVAEVADTTRCTGGNGTPYGIAGGCGRTTTACSETKKEFTMLFAIAAVIAVLW